MYSETISKPRSSYCGGDICSEHNILLLAQVAAGAAELYTGQLAQIRELSGPGAQQLAADLEYFCNVLAALSVALPADLVTWQARCGHIKRAFI
jgi:hypothetical protein